MSEVTTRKLIVVSTSVVKEGSGPKGAWALSEVTATDEHGRPVEQKLKTFEKGLKRGEPIEFEIEKQTHEKYGTSFLLKLAKGSGGGGLGPKVDELRERVTALEETVQRLDAQIAGRQSQIPSTTPVGAGATPAFGGDDDIPF